MCKGIGASSDEFMLSDSCILRYGRRHKCLKAAEWRKADIAARMRQPKDVGYDFMSTPSDDGKDTMQ